MSDRHEQWMGNLREESLESERVFKLIASLSNVMNKDIVVETIEGVLGVAAVERNNSVTFGEVALQFDDNGQLLSMSRTIDGSMR